MRRAGRRLVAGLLLLAAGCGEVVLEPVAERLFLPTGRVDRRLEARRSAAVEIDGVLAEWGAADAVRVAPSVLDATGGSATGVEDDADLSAVVAALWDSEHLYLAARVTDPEPEVGTSAPGYWWEEDAIAFAFDVDHDRASGAASWPPGDCLFAFVADPAGGVSARWWRQGHVTGVIERPAPAAVRVAVRSRIDGYLLEAAIPLTVLAQVTGGRLPPTLGFSIQLRDPEPAATLVWVGQADDGSTWGELALLEALDVDQDGWPVETDCDDGTATSNPGAPELPANGRDDDCDGVVDEGGGPPRLEDLWHGRARFVIDQDPVPVPVDRGNLGGVAAIERPDIAPDTLYLYYRCLPVGAPHPRICLAVSADGGASFPVDHGEVVGPVEGHQFSISPTVFAAGGRWVMTYEESNVAATYWAESSDGIGWTVQGRLVGPGASLDWDADAAVSPGSFLDGDLLYVLYAGLPAEGLQMDIGFASGPGPASVRKWPDNPALYASAVGWSRHVASPRALREDGWIYLLYEGASQVYRCDPNNQFGWGLARSRDWVVWDRYPGNPLALAATDCGAGKPNPYRRHDGQVFVYRNADDLHGLVREALFFTE